MELEDLKNIWKQPSITDTQWSTAELYEVLRGKSKSILSTIKRSMRIEITIGCMAFAVLIYQIITLKTGPIWWLMISLLLFTTAVAIYFYLKMRLVTSFDFSTNNLKDNLTTLTVKLEAFLRIYKLGNKWGLIVFYLLGLVSIYNERGGNRIIEYITSWQGALFMVLFTASIIGPVFFVDRILNKLYGKHLQRLIDLLKEFDRE